MIKIITPPKNTSIIKKKNHEEFNLKTIILTNNEIAINIKLKKIG